MKTVADERLDKNDPPEMVWMHITVAERLLWVDNPKLHDIGGIIESIKEHGFQELPKYDNNLMNKDGEMGAIKAGNGRLEALLAMYINGEKLPRGVAIDRSTKEWAVPVLIGTDAENAARAKAYAIDSNNIAMMGGDFMPLDLSGMYVQDGYLDVLQEIAMEEVFPVSVDGDDLDMMMRVIDRPVDQEIIEDIPKKPRTKSAECPSCGTVFEL